MLVRQYLCYKNWPLCVFTPIYAGVPSIQHNQGLDFNEEVKSFDVQIYSMESDCIKFIQLII